ncbi:hypothetical protein [Bradyrhizobium lupini]|uniref:hypothetical protein n=1 Tax=Rhizobium lupini TaxID=136996 RepID=UPI0034C604BD
MEDLKPRLANCVQLTTDGHRAYLNAVSETFGADGIDYGMLVRIYGSDQQAQKRYSPAKLIGIDKDLILGSPDMAHVSTSYLERAVALFRLVQFHQGPQVTQGAHAGNGGRPCFVTAENERHCYADRPAGRSG